MARASGGLVAGRDYPRGEGDFRKWFATDAACADYLEWLRWPAGFVCPRCGVPGGYRLSDGRFWCDECRRRVSVTSDTIFSHTRTPLTIWFVAAWEMAAHSTGVSARTLYRLLGFGSYETAWAIPHRYRHAISARGVDHLEGVVEVDESYFGGEHKAGRPGRSSAEGKYEVLLAVERKYPQGFGRVRARYIEQETDAVICSFIGDSIVPGATVHTDGAPSYRRLFATSAGSLTDRYRHERSFIAGSGHEAHEMLPAVHRVASLAQRWLAGTHQGAVEGDHLQAYFDVLLGSVEASASSEGAQDRQWRTGSLEVTAALPSPRFCPSASDCREIVVATAAVSPTSATLDTASEQPILRRAQ